jgi:hypothetical protein
VEGLLQIGEQDSCSEGGEEMSAQADVTIIMIPIDEDLYGRLLVVANRMGLSVPDVATLALSTYLEEG